MTPSAPRSGLVVLGGDETALAVVRNAAARGLRPWVVARSGDITTRSRLADCIIADDASAAGALAPLLGLGSTVERPPLVATNDRWLRFIMAHRPALEERFRVVHPQNAVLEICLNKRRFAEWCSAYGLPTPPVIDLPVDAGSPGRSETFPLILRPAWSNQTSPAPVPKACAVTDADQLRVMLGVFRAAGSPWVATRSLLPEAREQYSVGVAICDHHRLSFVAQKIRPLPDRCAVGSYVALRPHAGAEALAGRVLEALGFDFGLAEVEIMAVASGELFVIEVNPRPWSQFALSYRSGHDFLGFLLGGPALRPGTPRTDGLSWISLGNDLFTCFSRSVGLVRHGRLSIADYVRSLSQVRIFARFAVSDPWPALYHLLPQWSRLLKR